MHKMMPASRRLRMVQQAKGQFWTPDWVARAMVAYVLADRGGLLFDPAVGTGAFFRAAKAIAAEKGRSVRFAGMENDPTALVQALHDGLTAEDLASVQIADFVLQPPHTQFHAIVANPPYIRHHRLAPEKKAFLKRLSARIIGTPLDGRAGLHVYFFLLCLALLEENGRLAFLSPADACEGVFAFDVWSWVTRHFALDAVITFSPEASPFPDVDTNPLIVLLRKAPPQNRFLWAKCRRPDSDSLERWIRSGWSDVDADGMTVIARDVHEGLATGLSREPGERCDTGYVLGDIIKVMRGIETGANDFFFITAERARRLAIPDAYLVRAVGRTRDAPGDEITDATLAMLERKKRPTWIVSIKNEPLESLPESVAAYVREGERLGIPARPTVARRTPWYTMERREPPPFLFTYLGRRTMRFIRNTARVVPLTGFLCVYPRIDGEMDIDTLWAILRHPDLLMHISRVGKSYGRGAIKVEPGALERLPVPRHVLAPFELPVRLRLFASWD